MDSDPSGIGYTEWISSQEQIQSIRRSLRNFKSPMLKIMRVSQLDTELLDQELLEILKEQIWNALSLFKWNVREKYKAEIIGILQLIMYRYSIFEHGATYGAMLQNLKYRNEARHKGGLQSIASDAPLTMFQKLAYGVLTIGGKYGVTKLNNKMTEEGWGELTERNSRKKIWKAIQMFERTYNTLTLANFLIFLYNGRYRTLVDRILQMRLVYAQKTSSRQISFEFLNRQLVWHAFTEFLLFIVPLVNTRKILSRLKAILLPKSMTAPKPTLGFLPAHICPICYDKQSVKDSLESGGSSHAGALSGRADILLNNPYITNCGHKYCFYCIMAKLKIEDEWPCLRCGVIIKNATRSTVDDILESEMKTII